MFHLTIYVAIDGYVTRCCVFRIFITVKRNETFTCDFYKLVGHAKLCVPMILFLKGTNLLVIL